jgi:ribosomal protein S18 acetylase RimI-like enzyme
MTTEATSTRTEIVPATADHSEFIAWVQLAASRSHTDTSIWEVYLNRDEQTALAFLKALNSTDNPHYGHISTFNVLEVDGVPAAAMCGYFDEELGMHALVPAFGIASDAVGMTPADVAAGMARIASYQNCAPTHVPGAWIIEWVATLPEYRRQGLVDRLLAHTIENGRKRCAKVAEIGVLIGNDKAQRAYEKAGFVQVQELRDADYEAAFHTPGMRLLRRDI